MVKINSIYTEEYDLLITMIKEIRVQQNLNQTELGISIGRNYSHISKLETKSKRLDVIELRNICIALNVSFPEFIKSFEDRLLSKRTCLNDEGAYI